MNNIVIEDIEDMRRREGIFDLELREDIRRLKVGDIVNLTFINRRGTCVTVPVCLRRIRGVTFRGRLVKPVFRLRRNTAVDFTIAHIHSVAAKPAACI